MNRLLRRRSNVLSLAFLGGLFLMLDIGCGRAVLGDGSAGSGASSSTGTATNTSTSSVPASTSTGSTCGCEDYCNALPNCGIDTVPNCVASCEDGQVDADQLACVCNAQNCDETVDCIESSSSVGPGGTSVGGGLPFTCEDCIETAANSNCEPSVDQCLEQDACPQIIECMVACGWGNDCENQCVMGPGPAITAFYNAMACLVCNSCSMECAGTTISEICF